MRRVRRKGGNKEKVFGCDLLEHLTTSCQEIPHVLRCCSEFVEQHGVVDGIYRLSGVSSNIQKLRNEFENDGTPDLNKDVYLQDIHCVSSLCKAYFRELPNPLLTYQLYDKFAEAVAIQLEEERLVKIRDVLKELPSLHYRTLEFLMRHLVRMASYSSETNMHSRNLAIVWAPNLLRSKDIEASGFNGTAAFMEVRVQSIVVEFILTHVPQLFPEQGASNERRKSLPSPSAVSNQEEVFFKPVPTAAVINYGNISPGDGPLPIRPYHSIIEGTDKRKGSLKGRKWMSIFNIGGRFPDPRRRHKHSAKEKGEAALRPARSMDSLSTPSFPNEGSRRPAQRPPSTNMSSPVIPSSQSGSEVTVSAGVIGGSEYAVTYRRGTGLVSGGAGTQGTYTALDPDGLGTAGESLHSRSPGLSTKAGRRAAMHITGPTIVTVPLHITSNLALGVLQGGGGDRVIHRGRDKDGGDRGESKEGVEKVQRKESSGMEGKVEEGSTTDKEDKAQRRKDSKEVVAVDGNTVVAEGVEEEKDDGEKEVEKEKEEVREDCTQEPELQMVDVSREQQAESISSSTNPEVTEDDDEDANSSEYIEMKLAKPAGDKFEASDILNSTEVEGDDQGLSGYVEDNFDFLDQMDCSVLDHMDCSISYPKNEFSVEPPGHLDDEYEVMVQAQNLHHPVMELEAYLQPGSEMYSQSPTELKPHRPLSLDLQTRHTKSLSLPHMTSPVLGPEEFCSEEEISDDNDYSSEEDEDMFFQSLPPDFFLNNLSGFEEDTDTQEGCTDPVDQSKGSGERELDMLHSEEPAAGDQEQEEVKDGEDGVDGKQIMTEEEEAAPDEEGDQPEKHVQRAAVEDLSEVEDAQSDKENPPEFPLPEDEDTDDSGTVADTNAEEEDEVDNPHTVYSPSATQEAGDDLLQEPRDFSVESTEHPKSCVGEDTEEKDRDEEDRQAHTETGQEEALEIKENDENMLGESTGESSEGILDDKHEEQSHDSGKEQDSAGSGKSSEIWDEIEEVICEVIEDEESEQAEREAAAEHRHVETVGEDKEQRSTVSEEKTAEVDERRTKKTDCSIEVEAESMETTEVKLKDPDSQKEFEEKETCFPKTNEQEAAQGKNDFNEEAQRHDRDEAVSKNQEKENNDKERGDKQLRTTPSGDKQLKEDKSEIKTLQKGRKCEKSDSSRGGVGRKLVITKNPKFYQVKAVPVVPPKPQHCKFTALTLRQQQQQQQRERSHSHSDRGRENLLKVLTEQDRVCAGEHGRDGGEKDRERRWDVDEGAARDSSRNSPLSMCFDEAVAIATMRREKEKESQRDWGSEGQ
ncbi:rho GTPase-activating protein 30 isoform X2 [Mastacembelus armatus]|uniref:rho GTPase-activating protein 30 isoform X2 n=1 Tax=Mastacembelus armatus TaxID=205130 RepID=UPI000E458B7F|nr:rho GTPase-activating protein 30-like isoform X2 [Mastacembelus armatus]